jgi:hypothetical protein
MTFGDPCGLSFLKESSGAEAFRRETHPVRIKTATKVIKTFFIKWDEP